MFAIIAEYCAAMSTRNAIALEMGNFISLTDTLLHVDADIPFVINTKINSWKDAGNIIMMCDTMNNHECYFATNGANGGFVSNGNDFP